MHYTLEKPISVTTIKAAGEAGRADRRRTKPVRLCDVARAAGVSTATVSMVVNNNPRISPSTQRRVRKIADRLGYQPSHANQVLASQRSTMLAVLLPARSETFADAYFAELIGGICEQASRMGHTVLFDHATPDFIRRRQHLSMIDQRAAQGMLLLGFNEFDALHDDFDAVRHPVVVVDNRSGRENLDFVGCDHRSGAQQAMNYLLQLGHRKIGLVTSSVGGRDTRDIVEVYRAAMADNGIRPGEGWIADGQFTEEGGADAADKILRRHPEMTALFAAGDTMAIGALHAAKCRGLSVPQELSIVGFDNLRHAAFMNPALTTVELPLHAVGAKACERLIERINGRSDVACDRLPAHLVLRNSAAMAKDLPLPAGSSAA